MSNLITSKFLKDNSSLTPRDAVVAIIENEKKQFLLQLRDDKEGIFFPNHWGLFGGAVDDNETVQSALARELKEELGSSFPIGPIKELFRVDLGFKPNGHMVKRYFFHLPVRSSINLNLELNEGSEDRFFDADECLSIPNFTPYDRYAIWVYLNQHRINI